MERKDEPEKEKLIKKKKTNLDELVLGEVEEEGRRKREEQERSSV